MWKFAFLPEKLEWWEIWHAKIYLEYLYAHMYMYLDNYWEYIYIYTLC